ncbi:MAG: hypothetical protein P4L41_08295 [Flavipsychrobacter sp.]|nr:hypothetical protein [Flavipsychrobacter sp.]
MEKISVTHFDNKHGEWLSALGFYTEEIDLLKKRLTEIAGKNSAQDVLKEVEHYENQLTVQSDNIQALRHDIHANDVAVRSQLEDSKEGYVDKQLYKTHQELIDRFSSEEKVFKEVREEFMQFAATWM